MQVGGAGRSGRWFMGGLTEREARMDRTTGSKALLDRFATLEDPRQAAKVLSPLPEIVLLLLCATLAGADDFAVDGKTSRRTHARRAGREPLRLVSAWASRQRLVLGQEAVAGKSNEITAIPLLLERLALNRALVTIDAVGTQNSIAETI